MTDERKDHKRNDGSSSELSRRDFVALSVAAGLAAATNSASGKELSVIETNVEVKTPDGTCDAVFIHPAKGSHPGVLVWHDSPGLRPVMRDLGKRIAAEGYSVLVPNCFYRVARAPVFDASFDYANKPADREKYRRITAPFFAPGAAERDAVAYVAFLDAQSSCLHTPNSDACGCLICGSPSRKRNAIDENPTQRGTGQYQTASAMGDSSSSTPGGCGSASRNRRVSLNNLLTGNDPNKSLDASGGSAFRIMTGLAMLE